MNLDWNYFLSSENTSSAYDVFLEIFLTIYDEYCPEKTVNTNKRKTPLNPFMTQGLLISRNTREDLGKSYANCKTEEAKYLYTEYDRVYKRVLNASKAMHSGCF